VTAKIHLYSLSILYNNEDITELLDASGEDAGMIKTLLLERYELQNKSFSLFGPQLHDFIASPGVSLIKNPSQCRSPTQRVIKAPRRRKENQDVLIGDHRLKSPVF
jgi:hypothetical protein